MECSKMADNTNYFNIVEKFLLIIGPIIVVIWKGIDKYFEYQAKKDKEFVKEMVKEIVTGALLGVRSDIKEMKEQRKQDFEHYNQTLLDIYKEIKKP